MQAMTFRNLSRVLGLALISVCATTHAQQEEAVVVLRAVGPHVPDATVAAIAKNAAPFDVGEGMRAQLAKMPLEAAIAKVCGSYRDAYFEALSAANSSMALSKGLVLGDLATTIVFPACLYVERSDVGIKREVTPDENKKKIYTELTGGDGMPSVLKKFFGATANRVNTGDAKKFVYGAHRTAPVALTPVNMSPEKFKAIVGQSVQDKAPNVSVSAFVRVPLPQQGKIIIGGTVAAAETKCRKPSGAQFDAKEVAAFYRFADDRRNQVEPLPPNGQTSITIVDNGFMGADPSKGLEVAFDGSPFNRRYFDVNPKTTVARSYVISSGEELRPVSFDAEAAPDAIRGHGTHVTGLALGGPSFNYFLNQWPVAVSTWASVNILNVANGNEHLIGGAYHSLSSLIPTDKRRHIINMSLTHDGRVDNDAGEGYRALFKRFDDSLFVVAAGNSHSDVTELKAYPASLGGLMAKNVISVAALDGDGGLAPFSNKSGKSVDMAAPGCEIDSWISNQPAPVALSGTSQAAPAITFGGSLLWSLDTSASAAAVKQRFIVSGDLMDNVDDLKRLAYGVRLNIPKALLWFQDYIEVTGEERGRYVGEALKLSGARCEEADHSNEDPLPDVWAIKRSKTADRLFTGRLNSNLDQPCPLAGNTDGQIVFEASWMLTPTGFVELKPRKILSKPLEEVAELIVRPESRSN
ncbi:S8 family serine peptidase [Acidovorax sp. LjRoot66]|uniref:S8 family serine peptidase n=1 Tax=Acidovorax sp. LjRoot66 TaxID=3342334 RepID=UPI003ECF7945